jgi:hypothetical protein
VVFLDKMFWRRSIPTKAPDVDIFDIEALLRARRAAAPLAPFDLATQLSKVYVQGQGISFDAALEKVRRLDALTTLGTAALDGALRRIRR